MSLKNKINAKLAGIVDRHYDENDGISNILYMRSDIHNGIVKNYGKMTDILAAYHTEYSFSFLISSPNDDEQVFVGLWELEPDARRKVYDFIVSYES